ncbi:SHOCT domain-containing protein [Candidatus Wolfebacteria bacterium]|nr:SHOCT domain-containing protein [Candidatus Wolfebacteria bacterium]
MFWWGGGFFGGFMMIIIWTALIVFLVWLVREVAGKGKSGEKSALEILKERYVRGEIDRGEFESKKKDIEK